MAKAAKRVDEKRTRIKTKDGWIQNIQNSWQLYIMIIIPLVYILVFKFYPMYGAIIAFKDFSVTKGIWGSEWVQFKHFVRFFSTPRCMQYIVNTVAISTYSIIVSFPLQVGFAIALNYVNRKWVKKSVQLVSYMPHFISTVIIVSMLNMLFDNRTGVLDSILELITGHQVDILGNPAYFRSLYVWSGIWQNLGWSSILYLSALSGVSPELHEAARIDGANKWQRVWHVDLMGILPTIAITMIMNVGHVLSVGFDKTFLMQNATNLKISETLATYGYKIGIGSAFPEYSYSSAIGLMSALATLFLVTCANRIVNKMTGTGLW